MEFCLKIGCSGPEIGLLVDDLRALGLDIEQGHVFTDKVVSALKMFQQSHHDHKGMPLRIDGRLCATTALAIDAARGRCRHRADFDDSDLPPMSKADSILARRSALIALDEYMRASGEQGVNNFGPDVARYQAGNEQIGDAWSLQFATYCYQEACGPDASPFGYPQDVQDLVAVARSKGWLRTQLNDGLLAGDLIVWHFNDNAIPAHRNWHGQVGIVWHHRDDMVITLEGDRGPYPSLVRPYRHKMKTLVKSTDDHRFREGVAVIRVS